MIILGLLIFSSLYLMHIDANYSTLNRNPQCFMCLDDGRMKEKQEKGQKRKGFLIDLVNLTQKKD